MNNDGPTRHGYEAMFVTDALGGRSLTADRDV
jgi:hypothetical protein